MKTLTTLPVAVITNGSLLYLPEVRLELYAADAILPSLDASNPALYRKINRPHPEITLARLLAGLEAFRAEFHGRIWIEVMLVQGLNNSESALREIATALLPIQPDEVHILQPTRPPAETWVRPSDEEGLLRARTILGDIARVVQPSSGTFDLSSCEELADAVISIITRHPMQQDELNQTLLCWSPTEVITVLKELESSGRAQVVERYGNRFWCAAASIYPDDAPSSRRKPPTKNHNTGNR